MHREPALRPPLSTAPLARKLVRIARKESETPVAARPAPEAAKTGKAWQFTILGAPMGKPRQTQSDKWKKRPCVVRYRAWADSARAAAPKDLPSQPIEVSWVAYLPMAKSWRKPLRDALRGQLHRHKPDRDNIDKAVCDALWKDDSVIAKGSIEKRWDDGNGPRIELSITTP